jgi:hypothetical protein
MAAGLAEVAEIGTERWRAEVAHYLPLIARVIVPRSRSNSTSPAEARPMGAIYPDLPAIQAWTLTGAWMMDATRG